MIEFAFKHKLIKLQSDNDLDCSFFDNISFIYYLMVELSYLFGQFCIFADIYYNIMKIIFINALRILMILVIIISCGVAYVVYEDTLAAWWIPVGVALIIVIATIPFYKGWIWLTTMDNKVINCCCHLVCVGAISCVLFLGGHFLHEILKIDPAYLSWVAYKFTPKIPKQERFVKIAQAYHSIHLDIMIRKSREKRSSSACHVSMPLKNRAR